MSLHDEYERPVRDFVHHMSQLVCLEKLLTSITSNLLLRSVPEHHVGHPQYILPLLQTLPSRVPSRAVCTRMRGKCCLRLLVLWENQSWNERICY